jgi:tetratricopeptide (TPR) repeat protein
LPPPASAAAETHLQLLWDSVALLKDADCDPLLLALLADATVARVAAVVQATAPDAAVGAAAGGGAGGRARAGSMSAASSAAGDGAGTAAGAASLPPAVRACWAAMQACLLRAAARDYPFRGGADASFAAGQVLLAMRAYPAAVSCFSLSVVRHGEHCATAHNLGLCMAYMGKPVAALAWFDEALALEPELAEARRWRRAVLRRIAADERKREFLRAENRRNN